MLTRCSLTIVTVWLFLFASLPLATAQDWAKKKLEESPRHGEFVSARDGMLEVPCYIVYPEVKDKAPAVIVIHEIFGLTNWVRGVCDDLAARGYIAIAPDLLLGDTYESVDDARRAISALSHDQVMNDLNVVRDYVTKLPACNGQVAVSGFCYGRYPETDERLTAPALNQAVYFHTLGQNQSEDALIHEDPEHPERGFSAFTSRDGRWLMMWVREGTARKNRLWFKDLAAGPRSPWNKRFDDFDAQYVPLGNVGSIVWLRTDLDAPMGRVVTVDASIPKAPLIEIVPEADAVLSAASYVGDRLFLTYLEDALTRVRTVDPSGNALGDVELPGVGTASGFGGEIGDEETFFGFSAYTSPTSTYRFDVATGAVTLVQRPRVPFDSDAYETEQVFFSSKDGTRVPMFLTYRKGLERDGSHPTLLYGYGGFNISMRPGFSPANAAWLDMGGVYAVACLRGGGEYGREWHQAGTKERKQNVFDDFIAAAEHLVDTGITRPERLGIFGGSNGGLLVGACVNQRPDLYGAAIPAVGVMDMLRYHRFTIGAAWASDYGRSDDPEMFPYLYAYSPYHNATPGTSYPAIMVTTADHDDRVVPAHSFKYASAMQFAQAGDEPVLIRIDTRAGHGAGKSRQQSIEEVADRWAFFAHHLGLEVAAP